MQRSQQETKGERKKNVFMAFEGQCTQNRRKATRDALKLIHLKPKAMRDKLNHNAVDRERA